VIGFVGRRLVAAALVLLLVVSFAFLLLEALPGGPGAITEDPRVPASQRERLRTALGLDRPPIERYARFLFAAARGNWGVSFAHQRPVTRVIAEVIPHTAALAGAALAIELLLGVPLGLFAARRAGGAFDRLLRTASLAAWSLPSFWLGLALLVLFALRYPILPAGGLSTAGSADWPMSARLLDSLRHLALPALALGIPAAAGTARFARAAVLEIAREPQLTAARARGLRPTTLYLRHVLRPASSPLVELVGLSAAALLSGSLAVEIVFSRPGLGRLAHDALAARDYPVLLASAAVAAVAVLSASLATELTQAAIDPRVRSALDEE
jgi:peptide/nickel transport system permease protein